VVEYNFYCDVHKFKFETYTSQETIKKAAFTILHEYINSQKISFHGDGIIQHIKNVIERGKLPFRNIFRYITCYHSCSIPFPFPFPFPIYSPFSSSSSSSSSSFFFFFLSSSSSFSSSSS
jgi:hypothetical protein